MAKPDKDIRRIGTVLLLGVVAGAAARYYAEARARSGIPPTRMIDWEQARSVALRVSQWDQAPIADRVFRRDQYVRLVKRSEPLIADYLGVQLPAPISRVYVFDRREWLDANFVSFEQLFGPIEEIYERNGGASGATAVLLGGLNSKILGTQIGALLGFLARRVLGQYDLSLLSPNPEAGGALYYVESNISRVQSGLGLNDEDYRLWIALHETTHAFEFEAYPWVRAHFNNLLQQYFDELTTQLESLGSGLIQLAGRVAQSVGTGTHWIEAVQTPQQRVIFDKLQALMSLVEGYGNHVMNVVGRQMLPSFDDIEHRMAQRQQTRTLVEQLFNRITGMDLKLAQYQQGEAFVNAVVDARGIAFAARVWERVEHLPTMEEIREPQKWVARMDRA